MPSVSSRRERLEREDAVQWQRLVRRREAAQDHGVAVGGEQQRGGDDVVEPAEHRRAAHRERVEGERDREAAEHVDDGTGGLDGSEEQPGEEAERGADDDLFGRRDEEGPAVRGRRGLAGQRGPDRQRDGHADHALDRVGDHAGVERRDRDQPCGGPYRREQHGDQGPVRQLQVHGRTWLREVQPWSDPRSGSAR
jgi:hypothetical protein